MGYHQFLGMEFKKQDDFKAYKNILDDHPIKFQLVLNMVYKNVFLIVSISKKMNLYYVEFNL